MGTKWCEFQRWDDIFYIEVSQLYWQQLSEYSVRARDNLNLSIDNSFNPRRKSTNPFDDDESSIDTPVSDSINSNWMAGYNNGQRGEEKQPDTIRIILRNRLSVPPNRIPPTALQLPDDAFGTDRATYVYIDLSDPETYYEVNKLSGHQPRDPIDGRRRQKPKKFTFCILI